MSEPAFNAETSRQARRFRLVDDGPTDATPDTEPALDPVEGPVDGGAPPAQQSGAEAILSMVPARLLVAQDAWREVADRRGADQRVVRATIPLLGSLAKIRSEADAALALTGVLESLVRRFHITPPCALTDDTTVAFVAPTTLDLSAVAGMIDEALVGQVRATDLQGALRQRMEATVEETEPPPNFSAR